MTKLGAPSVVVVVIVLQRLEGLSSREAAERYCFDNRWRYAAGVGDYDTTVRGGRASPTVLLDMRERLRQSEHPNRTFDVARQAAKEAGLVGRKRVLDSTPSMTRWRPWIPHLDPLGHPRTAQGG